MEVQEELITNTATGRLNKNGDEETKKRPKPIIPSLHKIK
jgi:hypothetical protein